MLNVACPKPTLVPAMAISKKRKRIQLFLLIFWTSVISWQLWQMQAKGVSDSVVESDLKVTVVSHDNWIMFTPADTSFNTGVLFYPGALVQPKAYAPFARELAETGYTVIIQEIPYRTAFTHSMEQQALDDGLQRIQDNETIENWVISGHSKGGALAAAFADKYPTVPSGLLLIGTSHPRESDLSHLSFPVTKIYASEDGLASPEEVRQFAVNLPESTNYILVEGGNHSQFGWYGFQLGSGTARISSEEQHQIMIDASLLFLSTIR